MKLTDEQYNQAARYVDGEMDASEKEAFEVAILQNTDLLEEVEAYKEIRLLGEAIEGKISTIDQSIIEKKNANKAVWRMLEQARIRWEQQHEANSKPPPDLAIPEASLPQSEKAQVKVKSISRWRWLAAAMAIGLISLVTLWWYRKEEKKELKAVINQKEQDKGITDSKKQDTSAYTLNKDTAASLKGHTHSATLPLPPGIALQNKEKKERAVREQLVKHNFDPDSLPFELPNALAASSAYYKDQRHKEAIAGFKEVLAYNEGAKEDSAPGTRSKDTEKELTRFYAHYYLGQSFLSVHQIKEAIRELENAIKESPSIYWESKAQWYLGLACLKAGQLQKAKGLLEQVKRNDPSGAYRQKAIQLSRKLKKK